MKGKHDIHSCFCCSQIWASHRVHMDRMPKILASLLILGLDAVKCLGKSYRHWAMQAGWLWLLLFCQTASTQSQDGSSLWPLENQNFRILSTHSSGLRVWQATFIIEMCMLVYVSYFSSKNIILSSSLVKSFVLGLSITSTAPEPYSNICLSAFHWIVLYGLRS
jgi:hypothetical protein